MFHSMTKDTIGFSQFSMHYLLDI